MKNFLIDTKNYIQRNRMFIFVANHYKMYIRKHKFKSMTPFQKKKRVNELWQQLRVKTKVGLQLQRGIKNQALRQVTFQIERQRRDEEVE